MLEATKETGQLNSVKSLLGGSIDYAGLFPPAALSMPEAVINYATYRTSNYNWLLGRFVVTSSRLAEFFEKAPCDDWGNLPLLTLPSRQAASPATPRPGAEWPRANGS